MAHDELVRLTNESGETATLEVFTDAKVVVLDEVQSRFLFSPIAFHVDLVRR